MTQKKSPSGKKGKKPTLSSSTGSGSSASGNAKRAASDSAQAAKDTATTAVSSTASTAASTATAPLKNSRSTSDDKRSTGWLAPVALLFGLVGTGFSVYLWSQLKNLGSTTSIQLQSQAEAAKTDVATVKTELDENTAALTATLDEKTGALSAALQEKTSTLAAALENKTVALDGKVTMLGEDLREEVDSRQTELATSTASAVQELTSKTELEINNVSTSFNTGLALQRERTSERFAQLNQQLSQLDESVKTTNELASRGQRDWVLAEVNYLLRTGVHRVRLAGDVKAGVIALESASDRLHTLGDIDYLPVREQIAEEVAALRRVGPPDIEGLIFKLEQMSKRADSLPLPPGEMQKAKAALRQDPVAATASLGKSLMEKLNFSFEVTESGESAAPGGSRRKKPSSEQLSASESLRLHLQAARLSALRHDAENFRNYMDNAVKYSEEIFDQENDRVKTFIADLTSIQETDIVPRIPALGSSLSLFNKVDSKRGTQ